MSIWTSLSAEAALVTTLEATGRLATTQVGTSAGGTPILVWRIGGDTSGPPSLDTQAVVLFVGGQHGDEPAGREALLGLGDDLCNTSDATILSFLDDHGVLIVPTVNPDGHPDTRENADGVDTNRSHVSLDAAPETRAVAEVLRRARPALVSDHHEFGSGFASEDLLFAEPRHPAAYSGLVTTSEAVITAMESRATTESWTFADYPTGSLGAEQAQRLVACCGLRHAAAVLVETRETADDDPGQQARVDKHAAMAEEIRDYAISNAAALLSGWQTAADAKTAEGAAGATGYNTGDEVIDPPPLGYQVAGVIPAVPVTSFGVDVTSPNVVSMAQTAQPVIPLLFDASVDYAPGSGTRLFTLASAVPVATVAELAEVLSGSHEVVVEARVLTSFQSGADPDGTLIPIIGGDVSYDATAEVWSSLELETVGIDEATGQSWFPRFPDSLLAPYGNEIFVRRGIDTGGGGILWCPLGYFRIESVEQQGPHSESPIRISGQDRMGAIVEAELVAPREYDETTSIAAVFADLVGDVYPDASIVFDDASGFQAIGRRLVVDESRYEPLLEMADSLGKVIYFDGEGVLRVEDPPSDDEPVWRVAAGRGGVMLSSSRRVTREGAFNAVIVLGEGGGGDDPVRGVAVDNGPQSPTRWGGRFGRVPRTETLPQVTTASQAAAAARQILRRNLGAPYSADFTAKPNPALRPRHPVMAVQRDGNRELHVVETLSIPLVAEGDMPATTRERTHIVLGSTIS